MSNEGVSIVRDNAISFAGGTMAGIGNVLAGVSIAEN